MACGSMITNPSPAGQCLTLFFEAANRPLTIATVYDTPMQEINVST